MTMRISDIVKVVFIDQNPDVIRALAQGPGGQLRNCFLVIGDIFSQPEGILVSPTNSLGDMQGGIDALYSERFPAVETRLQRTIRDFHGGSLPIGSAAIVSTGDGKYPYLVASPTVTMPGEVSRAIDVYRAEVAVLTEVVLYNRKLEKIKEETGKPTPRFDILLNPGMGTGSGGLDPDTAAQQMRRAYGWVDENLTSILSSADNQTLW